MSAPGSLEQIFRLPEGERISFNQLLDDLDRARVIYVGESHDQIEHHQIQVRILQEFITRGKKVALAMEMFEKPQQSILDRWSKGFLTEEEFLKEIEWETTWSMDYHLYKDILNEVKNHHLKLLGLNIQKEWVRKVAQNGLENLSPEDKKGLPEMDLTDQHHRAYIASIYKSHRGGLAKDFEYFYQAQCLRDEAMAEAISDFLQSPEGKERTVLVFAGNGHVVFDFGIPKRLGRRTSIPYKTIVLKEWRKEINGDFNFSNANTPLSNFLWITNPNPPEKKRPRIGIVLREKEEAKGVWIERIIPQSPAEKAGLLPGDQFLAIEGKEIKKLRDLHDAFSQKGWGKEITLTILREGVMKEIVIILPSLKD
jgi:uncharacterized iron-regulated protein